VFAVFRVSFDIAGGSNVAADPSQSKKVSYSKDDEDDDGEEDDVDDDDDEEQEESASTSGSEPTSDDSDKDDSNDNNDDDDDGDDDSEPLLKHTSAAKTAVGSAAESRKRRLQELEDFVKSKSASSVKGILKSSTPSSASAVKLVKFAAKKNADDDLESRAAAPVYHEDIYGRLRDERGNIVNPDDVAVTGGQVGAYVPPGKRQKLAEESASRSIEKSTDENRQRVEMLTRQIKGQINRSDSF